MSQEKTLNHALPLVGSIICLVLEVLFITLGVDFWSFPAFLSGFFLLVYIPGRLISGWLNLSISLLERFTLELGVGYVATTLAYYFCRSLKLEPLYLLLIGLLVIYYLYTLKQGKSPWPKLSLRIELFSICFFIVLFLILLSCGWLNFSNWIITDAGTLRLTGLYNKDTVFYVSLVQELAHTFPPHYPYAGNFPLTYHFFPNLFASIFVRWVNLYSWDLVTRYLPVFYSCFLFLATIICGRKLTNNRWTALLAVFLLNFMGNFGFIHILRGKEIYTSYWEWAFVPQVMILNINPLQIATALVMLGLFCLAMYLENYQGSWFFLTVLLLGLIAFFKVYTAIQVVLGLTVSVIILWLTKRGRQLIYLSLAVGAVTVISAVAINWNSVYQGPLVEFRPWFLVYYAFYVLKPPLQRLPYESFNQLMFANGGRNFFNYFVIQGIFFVLGAFWLHLVGLKSWGESLFRRTAKPLNTVMATFILVGLIFPMLFTVSTEYYNSVVFLTLSLYLMSFYTADVIGKFMDKQKLGQKILIFTLFLALALPTTLNLFITKTRSGEISSSFVRLGQFIDGNLPAGSLVAHPLTNMDYILLPAMGGVRNMAVQDFNIQNIVGLNTAAKLRSENQMIYQTIDAKALQKIILRNKLDFIIEDQRGQINAPKDKLMTEIYRQDGYIINRVISLEK